MGLGASGKGQGVIGCAWKAVDNQISRYDKTIL
jgi:hypothetical protein